jgi:hypothetical protein
MALFISAHLDESGTHKGSPYTVMAGYVATEGQWAALDWDWKLLLTAYRLSSFHAHEFYHRSEDQYRQLSSIQQASFEEQALALLERSTLFSIAVGLVNKDHEEYRKDAGIKNYKHSHYGVCFHHCMGDTLRMSERHFKGLPVSFVLEAGHPNSDDVVYTFNTSKFGKVNHAGKPTIYAHLLGSLAFASDLSSLEAADLLAYRSYQQMKSGTFRTVRKRNHLQILVDRPFFQEMLRPAMVKLKEQMTAYSKSRRGPRKISSEEQSS